MYKILVFCIFFLTLVPFTQAQRLISYEKLHSWDQAQVDSIVDAKGVSTFFSASNGVDFYKVTYWTSYKHIDSLVKVSGAIVVPTGDTCDLPMAGYLHGTSSNANNVPSRMSAEAFLGILLAADGFFTVLPDYLGLGDSDTSVIIHPYVHAFSQGHTSLNIMRAGRELADSMGINLNGQLFITGYSQGGFSTMATHKLIEEEYPFEFQVTASAPMSGPYDLKVAQVDLIASDSVYATPGYLPYILLGYHSVFDDLAAVFPDITKLFKSPYDTLIPPLFYAKTNGIGYINGLSTPVPKHMIRDSFVNDFINDSLHPLRLALAESHLLDWTPQAPVKLHYCTGDEQVTFENSIRAFDTWTQRGATQITKQDLGNFSHGDCIAPSIISMINYFRSYKQTCVTAGSTLDIFENASLAVYPNPATGLCTVSIPEGITDAKLTVYDLMGRSLIDITPEGKDQPLDVSNLKSGTYVIVLSSDQAVYTSRLLVR